MALTVLIPLGRLLKVESAATFRIIGLLCKVSLILGIVIGFAYGIEFVAAYFGGTAEQRYAFENRVMGHYAWGYWISVICGVITPQFFWSRKVCNNLWIVFILSLVINLPTW